jgi:predicted DNA-binding protein (MmcQ/YjbR family)
MSSLLERKPRMHLARTTATALAVLLAMAASSAAQSPEENAKQLQEKLEAKLKAPFLSKAAWVHDYADAMKKATAEKKLIFAYFTRSYSP